MMKFLNSKLKSAFRIVAWLFDKLLNTSIAAISLLIIGYIILRYGFIALYLDDGNTFNRLASILDTDAEIVQAFVADLYANGGAELLSVSITVLIIERLNRRQNEKAELRDLITQMGSPDNSFAIEAVRKLRIRGWLTDGSLKNAYLQQANLEGVDLNNANLEGANLSNANLQNADLRESILINANLENANLREASLTNIEIISVMNMFADLSDEKGANRYVSSILKQLGKKD